MNILPKVKLYRNDLKGKTKYFELAGGSSYREFELPRVNIMKETFTKGKCYEGNPGLNSFGSSNSRFEVRVCEGSSYRGSTIYFLLNSCN